MYYMVTVNGNDYDLASVDFRLVGQRHKCATDMDNVINARKGI